jgi:hypothetical protein
MIEFLCAVGVFLALLFVAFGSGLVHWTTLLGIGAVTVALGLVLGVVVAVGYHLALYRALSPRGLLGPDWWWRPTGYNARLPASKRRSVMIWFYTGIASICIDFAGCLIVLAGILTM